MLRATMDEPALRQQPRKRGLCPAFLLPEHATRGKEKAAGFDPAARQEEILSVNQAA